MTVGPSRLKAASPLREILAERDVLETSQALALVRALAVQIAEMHDGGRLYGALTSDSVLVNEMLEPALAASESQLVAPVESEELVSLLPSLSRLDMAELPAEIDVARARFERAGISLDPRQVDLCQLGALLCRMLTGESVKE